MDPDDGVPLLRGHVDEHAVAQDAGVVDEDVETAEGLDSGGDQPGGALPVRHVVAVGDGLAPHGPDGIHHFAGRADELPVPSTSAPRSLTTTLAPWRANSRACPRPIPRPPPVTRTTRPSQIPLMCVSFRSGSTRRHFARWRGRGAETGCSGRAVATGGATAGAARSGLLGGCSTRSGVARGLLGLLGGLLGPAFLGVEIVSRRIPAPRRARFCTEIPKWRRETDAATGGCGEERLALVGLRRRVSRRGNRYLCWGWACLGGYRAGVGVFGGVGCGPGWRRRWGRPALPRCSTGCVVGDNSLDRVTPVWVWRAVGSVFPGWPARVLADTKMPGAVDR